MVRIARAGLVLALGSAMVLGAGCRQAVEVVPPQDRAARIQENSLTQLADLLRIRQEDTGTPPAKAADLAKYEKALPLGYYKLKKGDVVLLYGASIDEGVSDKILAYEKQTPESGGYVLMQDGKTVKKLTAEEFKSAPKVASSDSSAKTPAK